MNPIPYLRRTDDHFPDALRLTPDPPEGLYYRVCVPRTDIQPADDEQRTTQQVLFELLQKPLVAVVGTRNMTPYGAAVIRELVPALVRAGCVIVSGLALGCDGQAHAAALDAGGLTIAVLGGGVSDDDIYPRTHAGLAARILQHGGALIGEFPPGTPTYKSHFPHRNRIIAGLCAATIVIEGEIKSGSMITGKLAAEFGRTVFAVPGPIHAPYSTGTNHLIQSGAFLYSGPQDVIEVLGLRSKEAITYQQNATPLAPEQAQIYQALAEPRDFDALMQLTGQPSISLMTSLTLLELQGTISKVGGCWIRTSI